MSDLVLRPRSATELVDAAFQVYRRAPVQFMVSMAVVYVPWLLVLLVLNVNITPTELPGANTILVIAVVAITMFAVGGGLVSTLAGEVYLGRPADVALAFRRVGRRLGALLMASVVLTVLLTIGSMLLLLPALYVIARFFLVRQVIVLEDVGAGRALSRTSQLSRGTKWHSLATLFLVAVLMLAVNFGVSIVLQVIPSRAIMNLLSTALSVVTGPLIGITETVLYFDLRIRNEGFDVEFLASAGTPAAQPSDVTA